MRASYTPEGGYWRGVVRDENGTAVWTCPHLHRNRDQSTYSSGEAASACARRYLADPVAWASRDAARVAEVEALRARHYR